MFDLGNLSGLLGNLNPGAGVNRSGPSTPPPIPGVANQQKFAPGSYMGQAMQLIGMDPWPADPAPTPQPAPTPTPTPSPTPSPGGIPNFPGGIIQTPFGPIDLSAALGYLNGGQSAPSVPPPVQGQPTQPGIPVPAPSGPTLPSAPQNQVINAPSYPGGMIQTPYGPVDLSGLYF